MNLYRKGKGESKGKGVNVNSDPDVMESASIAYPTVAVVVASKEAGISDR